MLWTLGACYNVHRALGYLSAKNGTACAFFFLVAAFCLFMPIWLMDRHIRRVRRILENAEAHLCKNDRGDLEDDLRSIEWARHQIRVVLGGEDG